MTFRCLVLAAPDKVGHQRQAEAIAARLKAETTKVLANEPLGPSEVSRLGLVLAAGRQSIAPARRIARLPQPRPFVAVLQPVLWRPQQFDLIWAPAHDRAGGGIAGRAPLVETLTAPSVVTPVERDSAAKALAQRLDAAPPFVGVLVGGPTRAHRFGAAEGEELAARLSSFARAHEATMLVTSSRRTPEGTVRHIRQALAGTQHVVFDARDPEAEPSVEGLSLYAAILGLAQAFIVTDDSIAMMSDAAATGKPIYGWRLPGGKAKFDRFYGALADHGAFRWFDGGLDRWTYPPLDAATTIADAIAARLGLAQAPSERI